MTVFEKYEMVRSIHHGLFNYKFKSKLIQIDIQIKDTPAKKPHNDKLSI